MPLYAWFRSYEAFLGFPGPFQAFLAFLKPFCKKLKKNRIPLKNSKSQTWPL